MLEEKGPEVVVTDRVDGRLPGCDRRGTALLRFEKRHLAEHLAIPEDRERPALLPDLHLARFDDVEGLSLVAFFEQRLACLDVLVPPLSAIGAALSFLIASLVYSLAGAAILFRRGEVVPITFSFGSIVFLAGTFLSLAALTRLGSILAAGLLTICLAAVLLSEKSVFIRMLSGQSDNRNARGRSGQL